MPLVDDAHLDRARARRCAATVTVPPSGEYLTALSTRFARIWPQLLAVGRGVQRLVRQLDHEIVPVHAPPR